MKRVLLPLLTALRVSFGNAQGEEEGTILDDGSGIVNSSNISKAVTVSRRLPVSCFVLSASLQRIDTSTRKHSKTCTPIAVCAPLARPGTEVVSVKVSYPTISFVLHS